MPTPDLVSETVARFFAAIRAGDVDAWLSTFSPTAESHDPVGAPPLVGHDALRNFFCGILDAFDSLELREDQVFAAGNGAAVKWTGKGTGKTGRSVRFEGIDVFEMDDQGNIVLLRGYWNPAAMMADLQG